jgi:hypothetical protein
MTETGIRIIVTALAMSTVVPVWAQGTNPPGVNSQHYQCYDVVKPKTVPRKVMLQDQFGRTGAVLAQASFLCNPVAKNGGKVPDETTHLVCYTIRPGKFDAKRVQVQNQFGDEVLTIGAPRLLCLPSLKKVVP